MTKANRMVSSSRVTKKIDYSGARRRARIKRIKHRRKRAKPIVIVKLKGAR